MTLAFEQGPIRPPSEARSLLNRVTRNCPWNHCTSCPAYKGACFSLRTVEEVEKDIDTAHEMVETLRSLSWRDGFGGWIEPGFVEALFFRQPPENGGIRHAPGGRRLLPRERNRFKSTLDRQSSILQSFPCRAGGRFRGGGPPGREDRRRHELLDGTSSPRQSVLG